MSKKLTFTQSVNAPAGQVYYAFTNAQALQEWFADAVEADGRDDGRFYAWWNQGYYASGQFKETKTDEKVVFSWQGPGEPAPTTVEVSLAAQNGTTQVTLKHSGLGESEDWKAVEENFKREWPNSLANLQSVLESGIDKRIYERPMLGFYVGGMIDERQARNLGVPVHTGVHVVGVLDGMGAKASGLENNDVLHAVDGVELVDFQTLSRILSGKKGGDVVEAVVYRGPERMVLNVELSRRPIPDYPAAPAEIAQAMKKAYQEGLAPLKETLKGVSEEEAMHRPAEGEWNAKEVLGHLLISERWSHLAWELQTEGNKPPGFPSHQNLHTVIAETYNLSELVTELEKSIQLNLKLIKELPQSFQDRRGSYFNNLSNVENGIQTHLQQHTDQIKAAVESARK